MDSIFAAIRNFARDEDGITAIEYGLIAAVMAVAIATSLDFLSEGLEKVFTDIKGKLVVA